MPNGTPVREYTLTNQNGMVLKLLNLGGIITSLMVPDKHGDYQDIVLGYTSSADYISGNPNYFGAIIGRYGNRIANAEFNLDNEIYSLEANHISSNLHGGSQGFHTKIWDVEILENTVFQTLKLTYKSPDGEAGFPGNLLVNVYYTLTHNNELHISYEATTDKKTIVNLTQHTYFNLSGDFTKEVVDHECQFNADFFIPIDEEAIPNGIIESVENTVFDFRSFKKIGTDINAKDLQIKYGGGYDHTLVINGSGFRSLGEIVHRESGRKMQIFTDQPGFQLYTGNFLESDIACKSDAKLKKRTGFCIETQCFPNTPNQMEFPSAVLTPNNIYRTKTVFKFSV